MELLVNFKKHYANYLLSAILPALISGLTIPILKQTLGASTYGNFSILFNGGLLLTATLSGWINQSTIRYFSTVTNRVQFSRHAMSISVITQIIAFVPIGCFFYFVSKNIVLGLAVAICVFISSIQATIVTLTQMNYLSRKIVNSESIRVLSYILVALLLVKYTGINQFISLFIAAILSYLLSFLYLCGVNKFTFTLFCKPEKPLVNSFARYGIPLSFWFIFATLFSYVDKLFISFRFGSEIQGHYQALFDFLSKTISLIIVPAVTSLSPLLTAAYQKGSKLEIIVLIKKIIVFEILGMIAVAICYWAFGIKILFRLLSLPMTFTLEMAGFIIIIGTFIWQIAIVMHKKFELKFRSLFLLKMVMVAFFCQILLYVCLPSNSSIILYPIGYLTSAMVYLFLVSYKQLLSSINSYRRSKR